MEEKSERFVMRVPPEFFRMVDDWRRRQSDIPSRSDAVRTMAILGFTYSLEEKTIIDVMQLIADMAEANDIPDRYAESVNSIFERFAQADALRTAMVSSLDSLKNLPPAEPIPESGKKTGRKKASKPKEP